MKVAWTSDTFEQNNGIAVYLHSMMPHVSKRADVTLYTGQVHAQYPFKVVSVPHFSYPVIPAYDIMMPLNLKIDADVIHNHTPFSMGLYAALSNKKKVVTAHFLPYHFLEWAFGSKQPGPIVDAFWAYESWLLNKFDKVVCMTHEGKKLFQSKGVKRPIEVVPNGMDLAQYKTADPALFAKTYGAKKPYALFIGRADASKRPQWFIEAAKKLPKRNFVFVGFGGMLPQLERPKNVLFVEKKLSRPELMSAFAGAAMAVMPSEVETEGLVAQEGMAVGTPALISDNPILKEVVGKAGFSCKNPEEIAQRAEQIFSDAGLRAELKARCKQEIEKRRIEHSADKLAKIYDTL